MTYFSSSASCHQSERDGRDYSRGLNIVYKVSVPNTECASVLQYGLRSAQDQDFRASSVDARAPGGPGHAAPTSECHYAILRQHAGVQEHSGQPPKESYT